MPKTERACRHCGCTENNACITPAGPCSWISAGCCSNWVCRNLEKQRTHLIDHGAGSLRATHGTYCGIRLQYKVIGNKIFHVAQELGGLEFIAPRNVVIRADRGNVDCAACRRVMNARAGEA